MEKKFPDFTTIEVDQKLARKAAGNLSKYMSITVKWGLSVSLDEAREFIKNDKAIIHHENYPDVFIDTLEDPVQFYLNEIDGKLFNPRYKPGFFKKMNNLIFSNEKKFEENIFKKIIPPIKYYSPLFLLDSAGGMGFLEFQKVNELMDNNSYFIILDDIHHLKHFRSYKEITENSSYTLLDKNLEQGWLIAKFSPL